MALDVAAGRALMNIHKDVAYALIKNKVTSHHSGGSDHALTEKAPQKSGIYKVSAFDHMSVEVERYLVPKY